MHQWEPVLDVQSTSKARLILSNITEKIQAQLEQQQSLNLMEGKTGQLLFLMHGAANEIDWGQAIEDLINQITGDPKADGSLMKGLAGTGFLLKIINDKYQLFDAGIMDQFYYFVRKFLVKDLQAGNYDFMYGYMGECYFLLEETNNSENEQLFSHVANTLRRQAIPQPKGIGWISAKELWQHYPGVDYSTIAKDCNLGMSHGSPGIILILAKMQARYPELKLSGLINEALSLLLSEESEANKIENGYYYTIYSGELGKKFKGQLSWCYSDLGISCMFLDLWEITKQPEYWVMANKLAAFSARKTLAETGTLCGGLCHGAAGIAHLFNKLYQKTKHEQYREAAVYWYTILFDDFLKKEANDFIYSVETIKNTTETKRSNDNGFLQGLAGIGLSLYAAISDEYPVWDKLLLL